MTRKFIFIGLDGATWDDIDIYIENGKMPNLHRIIENGVKGVLESVIPLSSSPAWTSILTGTNPGKHGVFGPNINEKREIPSIWEIISQHNIKSIVVNDLVTYPPLKINGIMISGSHSTPSKSRDFVYPPNLISEIDSVTGGFKPSLASGSIEKLCQGKFEEVFNEWNEHDNQMINTSLYLSKKYDWDVFSVMLQNPDWLHHHFWGKKEFMEKFYSWLDDVLGKIYEIAITNNASLFIVSDHGGGPVKKFFLLNQWLQKLNFSDFSKVGKIRKGISKTSIRRNSIRNILSKTHLRNVTAKVVPESIKKMVPVEDDETGFIDPNKTKIFSETNNVITVNIEEKNEYADTRNKIIDELLKINDNGKRVILEAYKKEDLFNGPFVERAYDILFLLNYGYKWTSKITDGHYLQTPEEFNDNVRTGDHRPEGIFVGIGPEIEKGKKMMASSQLWDVLPTILHTLDLPIPSYIDGKVLKEIFRKESKSYSKKPNIKDEIITHETNSAIAYTTDEEKEIKEKLEDLGYI